MFVITADQRASRSSRDRVPAALADVERLVGDRLAAAAERTVGDEIQLATEDPVAALQIALHLVREEAWSVGVGVGSVEKPLPRQVREARGEAFLHARTAVERAKKSQERVAVESADTEAAADAEALVRLLIELRDRRSAQGWEVADLLAGGMTQKRAASVLGITPTAVSLRAKAASLRTEEAAIPALGRVLARLDGAA
ncbi:MAG TPA: DNA-binding protein [Microbacterium sp.]|nr:DNA-binding protein [Microbacterium sp.]